MSHKIVTTNNARSNYTNALSLLLLLLFRSAIKDDIRYADYASNLSWTKSNNDPYILSWTADLRLTISYKLEGQRVGEEGEELYRLAF